MPQNLVCIINVIDADAVSKKTIRGAMLGLSCRHKDIQYPEHSNIKVSESVKSIFKTLIIGQRGR